MPKIKTIKQDGSPASELTLKDEVWGIEPNKNAVYEAVKNYLANQRRGTQSAKTRSEARGGGRKPYRQKGTGRARQGSTRASGHVGGGIVFAPKPRSYAYHLPKKLKRLAILSALSSKVADKEMIVVDKLEFKVPKTKEMVEFLSKAGAGKKTLLITKERIENVVKSASNIPSLRALPAENINVYEIINCDSFVLTKDAVKKIEEVYAK